MPGHLSREALYRCDARDLPAPAGHRKMQGEACTDLPWEAAERHVWRMQSTSAEFYQYAFKNLLLECDLQTGVSWKDEPPTGFCMILCYGPQPRGNSPACIVTGLRTLELSVHLARMMRASSLWRPSLFVTTLLSLVHPIPVLQSWVLSTQSSVLQSWVTFCQATNSVCSEPIMSRGSQHSPWSGTTTGNQCEGDFLVLGTVMCPRISILHRIPLTVKWTHSESMVTSKLS